jgi:hypothetical protein
MKRVVFLVFIGLCLSALLFLPVGCGNNTADKHETPAGHPDELKDSTRFDPAPDTTRKDQPRETPQ